MKPNSLQEIFKTKPGLIIVLVFGLALGLFVGLKFATDSNSCVSKLHFIKPNLDCESYDEKLEKLNLLQDKLQVVTDGIKKTGNAKRISVFVRDLKTSRFAGVNDNDIYYMASLLKTPLLIGGFKLAEVEPKIMDQEMVYTGTPNLYEEQLVSVSNKLKVGDSYSVKELMRRSVVYSDNTSAQILFDFYPNEFMDRILQALGIQLVKTTGEKENLITARSYANVFRILYNASYLTKEYSDEALSILTKTEFKNGATAKLPQDLVVAHKFAERTVYDASGQNIIKRQLHECGIVYAKNEPYIFCIMTEGDDYKNLEGVISDMSLIIYQEMIK